jgi:hypothetical protein
VLLRVQRVRPPELLGCDIEVVGFLQRAVELIDEEVLRHYPWMPPLELKQSG